MSLRSEIFEQPDRLRSLLASRRRTVEEIAAAIRLRNVPYVFLAARGTSDNAGRYANYLLGTRNQQLTKSELVILLKVTIIRGDAAWQQQAQELNERMQSMRRPLAVEERK